MSAIPEPQPYPARAEYEALYPKYLQGETSVRMLDLAKAKGKRALDLCGGGGEISLGLLARGAARVCWVDRSAAMGEGLPGRAGSMADRLGMEVASVEDFLDRAVPGSWEVALCRQAVNYWLSPETAKSLARAIAPGGLWIFNTFWRRPSEEVSERSYRLGEAEFLERARLRPDGWVEHEQIRAGAGSHATRFRWIPPEVFRSLLEEDFACEERREGASALWVCERRP